jgi:hypothetical protein
VLFLSVYEKFPYITSHIYLWSRSVRFSSQNVKERLWSLETVSFIQQTLGCKIISLLWNWKFYFWTQNMNLSSFFFFALPL